jgi:2-polyprenyl-3-methyl-5-hydroxy-6-metoxy-1,4-benzoquinol methylase
MADTNGAHITTTCRLCEAPARFWFTKNKHDLYRCTSCRLVFVHPIPKQTGNLYEQSYFCGGQHGFGYVNYHQDKKTDEAFGRYLDTIKKYHPRTGRLLDIGAATGAFVGQANSRGWQAAGVEVSNYAASFAREQGLDVKTGMLEQQKFPQKSFDAATLWDVIEHVPDPRATLGEVRRIVRDGGVIALNFPDAGSTYARLAGKRWQLIVPPEHLTLFNRRNMSALLQLSGFTPLAYTRIGKRFAPAYVFQVLYAATRKEVFRRLADRLAKSRLNNLKIPINLRDNLFIVARAV